MIPQSGLPRPTGLLLGVVLLLLPGGCQKMEARSLIKQGNSLYKSGKYEQALERFLQAEKLDPDFPVLQLHLGYASMALSSAATDGKQIRAHSLRAARAFKRYMALEPGDERGQRYYLQVLLDAGRLDEALGFLRRQHREHPADVKIVASLGVVSSRAGRFEEALKWYEKRAAMLPGEAKARYLIGTLCWKHLYKNDKLTGQARIELADRGIAVLAEALKLQKDYAEALTYTNLLYRERAKGQSDPAARERDMQQARRYYKQALALMKKGAERDGPRKEDERP